jgi:hypothetical protein
MITSFIMRDICATILAMNPESDPADDAATGDQLPAVLPPAAPPSEVAAFHAMIPTLIADAGDQASWRYIDFFTSNIRNPNTRRAYARACGSSWHGPRSAAAPSERSGPMTSPYI